MDKKKRLHRFSISFKCYEKINIQIEKASQLQHIFQMLWKTNRQIEKASQFQHIFHLLFIQKTRKALTAFTRHKWRRKMTFETKIKASQLPHSFKDLQSHVYLNLVKFDTVSLFWGRPHRALTTYNVPPQNLQQISRFELTKQS